VNVEKEAKVMRFSRNPFGVQIMIDESNRRMWKISTIWVT